MSRLSFGHILSGVYLGYDENSGAIVPKVLAVPVAISRSDQGLAMTDTSLIERLRARTTSDGLGDPDEDLINPDGPEAADRILTLEAEVAEVRAERDALLQKPIDLAKMDSIDEDASGKMVAYYWWQQAQEARAALKGEE